jgi:hypothetical protein
MQQLPQFVLPLHTRRVLQMSVPRASSMYFYVSSLSYERMAESPTLELNAF